MQLKIAAMWPEIALFITTCIVMIVGLSKNKSIRQSTAWIVAAGLAVAGYVAVASVQDPDGRGIRRIFESPLPYLAVYGKLIVAFIGLMLVCLMAGSADRELEEAVDRGQPFDAIRSTRAEFWAFFLFSLTGLMLCCGADDLIFLFLALELTSLPTYVMVALSGRGRIGANRSMESGVKYFFLGALGAAIFLYGFTMIYGGTGTTKLLEIQQVLATQAAAADPGGAGVNYGSSINEIAMLGLVLSLIGVCFKIAAVPMHFYTPDVYQGASSSVAGFLAFVPKAAGFFAILLLTATVGWRFGDTGAGLPTMLRDVLWIIAVLTMTFGNVLAVMQTSVKRMLAYSSIAHSGYMLVGVIAGPGPGGNILDPGANFTRNGVAAVLFYLVIYGLMSVGAFAVLAALERRNSRGELEEPDHIDDLRGLCKTSPALGWTMVICAAGLLGLPPLVGFFGKLPLFSAGIYADEIPLVIILGINSAIAAYYYLRLMYVPYIDRPGDTPNLAPLVESPFRARRLACAMSCVGVVFLTAAGGPLADFASRAAEVTSPARPARARLTPAPSESSPDARADAALSQITR